MTVDGRSGRFYGPEEPKDWSTESSEESEDGRFTIEELVAASMDLVRAKGLGFDVDDPEVIATVVAANKRNRAEGTRRQNEQVASAKHVVATGQPVRPESVVYYMRVGNRVKIGYSTNLQGRVNSVMPEEVLATEPGGKMLGEVRHRQFADLRVAREWFRMEDKLIEHIETLKVKPCATS